MHLTYPGEHSTNNMTSENKVLRYRRMAGIWNLGSELYKNAQILNIYIFKWQKTSSLLAYQQPAVYQEKVSYISNFKIG